MVRVTTGSVEKVVITCGGLVIVMVGRVGVFGSGACVGTGAGTVGTTVGTVTGAGGRIGAGAGAGAF